MTKAVKKKTEEIKKRERSKSRAKKILTLEDGVVNLELVFSNGNTLKVSDNSSYTNKLIGMGMLKLFNHVISTSASVEEAFDKCKLIADKMGKGELPSSRKRGPSKANKIDYLAEAVAEVRGVAYEQAKEWMDAKESESKGFKVKLRNHPEVASVLIRKSKERGEAGDSSILE